MQACWILFGWNWPDLMYRFFWRCLHSGIWTCCCPSLWLSWSHLSLRCCGPESLTAVTLDHRWLGINPFIFFIFLNYPSIMCYRVCFNNFFYLTNNLRTKEHLLIIVIFVTFYLINLSTFYISNLSHFVCKWVWGKLRKSH